MPGVRTLSWEADEPASPGSAQRVLSGGGMDPVTWSNGPGERYAVHAHAYEKVLYCAAGSITFAVDGPSSEFELRPGDGLVLPAGTTHSAVVGPQGCTCVEGYRSG